MARYRYARPGLAIAGSLIVVLGLAYQAGGPLDGLSGAVVRVIDGDTVRINVGTREIVVRVWGVDCPELRQKWGAESAAFTVGFCVDEVLHVRVKDRDRYGRIVGEVTTADGRDLGNELVRAGCAWWSRKYAPRDGVKRDLEAAAREGKVGLWALSFPVTPWEFRARGRHGSNRMPQGVDPWGIGVFL